MFFAGDDSPNPNHDSSEVTVRSLVYTHMDGSNPTNRTIKGIYMGSTFITIKIIKE